MPKKNKNKNKNKKPTAAQRKRTAKQAAYRARKAAEAAEAAEAANAAPAAQVAQPLSNPLWEAIQAKENELAELNARLMLLECESGTISTGDKLKRALQGVGKWAEYQAVRSQVEAVDIELKGLREEHRSKRAETINTLEAAAVTVKQAPRELRRMSIKHMLDRKEEAKRLQGLPGDVASNLKMYAEAERMQQDCEAITHMVAGLGEVVNRFQPTAGISSAAAGGGDSAAAANSSAAAASSGPHLFKLRPSAQEQLLRGLQEGGLVDPDGSVTDDDASYHTSDEEPDTGPAHH